MDKSTFQSLAKLYFAVQFCARWGIFDLNLNELEGAVTINRNEFGIDTRRNHSLFLDALFSFKHDGANDEDANQQSLNKFLQEHPLSFNGSNITNVAELATTLANPTAKLSLLNYLKALYQEQLKISPHQILDSAPDSIPIFQDLTGASALEKGVCLISQVSANKIVPYYLQITENSDVQAITFSPDDLSGLTSSEMRRFAEDLVATAQIHDLIQAEQDIIIATADHLLLAHLYNILALLCSNPLKIVAIPHKFTASLDALNLLLQETRYLLLTELEGATGYNPLVFLGHNMFPEIFTQLRTNPEKLLNDDFEDLMEHIEIPAELDTSEINIIFEEHSEQIKEVLRKLSANQLLKYLSNLSFANLINLSRSQLLELLNKLLREIAAKLRENKVDNQQAQQEIAAGMASILKKYAVQSLPLTQVILLGAGKNNYQHYLQQLERMSNVGEIESYMRKAIDHLKCVTTAEKTTMLSLVSIRNIKDESKKINQLNDLSNYSYTHQSAVPIVEKLRG